MTIGFLTQLAQAVEANGNGNPIDNALLGNLRQAGANAPARSNLPTLGGTLLDGALNGSEVATVVMVPAKPGDVLKTMSLAIGKTKGKKVEAGFGALYAGTGAEPALLGQSKSAALGETVLAEKPLAFTLETAITVTEAMAPHGFLYAAFALEAETMPTCIGVAASKEAQALVAALTANSPLFLAAKAGSGLKATAKSKIEAPAAVVPVPIVVLS
jgi:hypothetical protein